jgi:hypothetical protein
MNVYTQAMSNQKREAHGKVVRMILHRPGVSAPLCSLSKNVS